MPRYRVYVKVMPAKKTQTVISGPEFRGQVQLTAANIREWCVATHEEAAASLLDDWNGGIIGLVGISLSSDNRTIENADFLLQGHILEEDDVQKVPANKFWTLPSKTSLVFRELDSAIFSFSGGLVSDYIDHTNLDYVFQDAGGSPLPIDTIVDARITGFSIRAFAIPFQANWAHLHVLLYPWDADTLRESYPLCDDPRFPGVQAFKRKFPLGPPAMLKWGQPINAAVLPGAPVEDFTSFPSAADFSRAITALFRSATQPDTKTTLTSLTKRLSNMSENEHHVSTLNAIQLELIWPPGPTSPISSAQGW